MVTVQVVLGEASSGGVVACVIPPRAAMRVVTVTILIAASLLACRERTGAELTAPPQGTSCQGDPFTIRGDLHRGSAREVPRISTAIPDDHSVPPDALRRFRFNGLPLAWLDSSGALLVHGHAFPTGLTRVSAIDVPNKVDAEIGVASASLLEQMSPRDLFLFLLQAGVVETYVHIQSDLCLEESSVTTDGGHRAIFRGTHTYVTSRTYVRPVAFELRLDPSNAVHLRGMNPAR